jgi:anti-sigma-K factor RskA
MRGIGAMKLAKHKALDALIGEYLSGSLRGAARKRFERALREEVYVAQRMDYWVTRAQLRPSTAGAIKPSPAVWAAILRDLNLEPRASIVNASRESSKQLSWLARWTRWFSVPRLALAALATLLLAITVQFFAPEIFAPRYETIAQLTGDANTQPASIIALRSTDGKRLSVKSDRAIPASPQQSFELWLLPKDGSAPISIAVLDGFDLRERALTLPATVSGRVVTGAKLAISVEPRGGSTTGAPTGPVILVGAVQS